MSSRFFIFQFSSCVVLDRARLGVQLRPPPRFKLQGVAARAGLRVPFVVRRWQAAFEGRLVPGVGVFRALFFLQSRSVHILFHPKWRAQAVVGEVLLLPLSTQ